VIDVAERDFVKAKIAYPEVMQYLTQHVLPNREEAAAKEYRRNTELLAANPKGKPVTARRDFLDKSWWRHWRRRDDMLTELARIDRYIALVRVAAEGRRSIYQFVDSSVRPDDSLQVFAFDDDYSFGILSSQTHRAWFDERCSKLKVDPRYTPTTVWDTFPWPASPAPEQVDLIAEISAQILGLREEYRAEGATLSQQYDTLRAPGKSAFRDAHTALDSAVIAAYGFDPEEDLLAQLLALNLAAAADPDIATAPGCGGRSEAYTTTYRLTAG
ncbi:MAG: type IIL restriction-modification enzyme MmeI, partial [Candidatus Nanopelagicales bacterium]